MALAEPWLTSVLNAGKDGSPSFQERGSTPLSVSLQTPRSPDVVYISPKTCELTHPLAPLQG